MTLIKDAMGNTPEMKMPMDHCPKCGADRTSGPKTGKRTSIEVATAIGGETTDKETYQYRCGNYAEAWNPTKLVMDDAKDCLKRQLDKAQRVAEAAWTMFRGQVLPEIPAGSPQELLPILVEQAKVQAENDFVRRMAEYFRSEIAEAGLSEKPGQDEDAKKDLLARLEGYESEKDRTMGRGLILPEMQEGEPRG